MAVGAYRIALTCFTDYTVAVLWAEMYLPPQLNKQHITQYPALIDTSVARLCVVIILNE